MNSEFLFIGHRGTRTDYDENTIIAFEKAIEFGANCIEFDVRETKDGKLIILHDPTLDRTTESSGLLKDLYYDEIKELKTKIYRNTIPVLSEVLKALKGKIKFMIELKSVELYDKVLKIVNEHNLLKDTIFSGRDLKKLGDIKTVYKNNRICYNITKGLGFTIDDFLNFKSLEKNIIKLDLISLRSNLITKKFIEVCHKFKIKSLAWDFISYKNPIMQIKSLIDLGIDGILFDDHNNIGKIKRLYNVS
jgi:glycerophosphoryl diester phosphodiesterase